MKREQHFSDHLEKDISVALDKAGIEHTHESERKEQYLDFYIPAFDTYIEVKQFHSERITKQLASQDNVIVLQGKRAVQMFIKALGNKCEHEFGTWDKNGKHECAACGERIPIIRFI